MSGHGLSWFRRRHGRSDELRASLEENARLLAELETRGSEVEAKRRKLEVANSAKSEFLARMSHELRTPLNAIIGFSEVLSEGMAGELNETQREYLTDVRDAGRHLLELINEILDLSKIEAGHMALDLGPVDVEELVDSGLRMVRERAASHSIALERKVPGDIPLLRADGRRLRQVVFNLLSNAVRFTPDGGRVWVRARSNGEMIEIAVADNGVGIAPERQGEIFLAFAQVPGPPAREGTGLGLTLSQELAELHGGEIRLESTQGRGSTFTLSLPLVAPTPLEESA